MIPQNAVNEWRDIVPWTEPFQVEQDLVITRALILLYNDPYLSKAFAFRGGTAMQKLFLDKPTRYSEDIDLVQLKAGPIGPAMDAIRKLLDPWLGEPRRSRKDNRFTLIYHYKSETPPVQPMRLKVEVNNAENFTVFELQTKTFKCTSSWFSGRADILTYVVEELLGTKLRALYQRKKGRDLYDLDIALEKFPKLDPKKVVQCFQQYLKHQGASVSRAQFESNLAGKLKDPIFLADIAPLLAPEAPPFDVAASGRKITKTFITLLLGDPWKGESKAPETSKKAKSLKGKTTP